jgi:hypothetical protein
MVRKRVPWQRKAAYQRTRNVDRLKPNQVDSIFEADDHANRVGLRLNTFATINWCLTEFRDHDALKAFAKIRDKLSKWLRRQGITPTWIFVHENPHNVLHTHVLMNLPEHLTVGLMEQLERLCSPISNNAILIKPRKKGLRGERLLNYLTKGTDYITALIKGGRATNQGEIDGKRWGCTENLATSARRKWLREAFKKQSQLDQKALSEIVQKLHILDDPVGERSRTPTRVHK